MPQTLAAQAMEGDNPAHAERLRIRSGAHRGPTGGLAPGYCGKIKWRFWSGISFFREGF